MSEQPKSNFQRIFDPIIMQAPQLAPKNTYCIHEWLAAGYDIDKDILPAIEEACKLGTRSIFSFSFFAGFIKRMHTKRLSAEAVSKAPSAITGYLPAHKADEAPELTPEQRATLRTNLNQLAKQLASLPAWVCPKYEAALAEKNKGLPAPSKEEIEAMRVRVPELMKIAERSVMR